MPSKLFIFKTIISVKLTFSNKVNRKQRKKNSLKTVSLCVTLAVVNICWHGRNSDESNSSIDIFHKIFCASLKNNLHSSHNFTWEAGCVWKTFHFTSSYRLEQPTIDNFDVFLSSFLHFEFKVILTQTHYINKTLYCYAHGTLFCFFKSLNVK